MPTPLSATLLLLTLVQQTEPAKELAVGDPAPTLQLDNVLGGAFDSSKPLTELLRGKVVVLEFSTSWCAGCRAAVPHWNELAKELAKEPVVFLSITNETKDAAARFIAETGLTTALGVDLDGSLFEAFGVSGIPDVIVLGRDGRIAGFSHPQHLDAATLRKVVAGDAVTFAGGRARGHRSWNQSAVLGDADPEPGTCRVRSGEKPNGLVQTNPKTGTIQVVGAPLATLYAAVLDCDAGDIEVGPQLPTRSFFDLRVSGKDGTLASTRALALEQLGQELQIDVVAETKKAKVLLLQRAAGHDGPPPPDPSRKGGSVGHGVVRLATTTASRLVKLLRSQLPMPMVDETGLLEPFAIDLAWDPERGVDGLRAALAGFGLTCVEAERSLPHYKLVVRAH